MTEPNSQLLIYQSPDGIIKIDVRLEKETVWRTQDHMSELFGKAKSTINEHIKNIFAEGENRRTGYEKIRKFRIFYQTNKLLQPGCHYFSGLSGKIIAGNPIPNLGHPKA